LHWKIPGLLSIENSACIKANEAVCIGVVTPVAQGVGLSLWERPIISKRYSGQNTPLKEGMVFALETWKGAEDGSGAARIEEEVVVTKDGCQIITNFPSDRLISCGLPGCEVF